ncbi:MAG: hypothetical protein IPH12_02085 [Saprospirales bacterium]|nr:hypothetical protein [Saprospirales bacterium]
MGASIRQPHVWGVALLSLLAWFLVVYAYPFPAIMSDSGDYVLRAQKQMPGVFRPFGYSWFLMKLHTVVQSARGLSLTQLLLHIGALIYFLQAIRHCFQPVSRALNWLLTAFLALSPLHIYMANSILSDSLFASISLCWIASGMFLLKRFHWLTFLFHLLALFLAMKVRYTGIIYPAISVLIAVLGSDAIWKKLALAIIPCVLSVVFYTTTRQFMYKSFGVKTFSGFAGWQMANNALHTFPYFELKPENIPDRNVRGLYEFVRLFSDTIYPAPGVTTTGFMWENKKPLKQYFSQTIAAEKPSWAYGNRWLYAGLRYEDFGNYFIRKYPALFARHFVLPNLKDVAYPPLGFLRTYQEIKQGKETCEWFDLPKETVPKARFPLYEKYVNPWLDVFCGAWNASNLLLVLAALFFRRRFRPEPLQWRALLVWIAFIGLFAVFSAYASTVEIRYLAPVYFVQVALTIVLAGRLLTKPKTV